LLDLHKQGFIDLDHLHALVLDEADQMLDMGFVNDVKKIKLTPKNRQTLFFLGYNANCHPRIS
jgi:ATP-dependent RNA helicase RhlE